ncbi:hypothetical protein PM082_004828 [Marasmius tenuissimus]|nr:hypothetical protein PM082_004828 [Marasmius tenuissimus]
MDLDDAELWIQLLDSGRPVVKANHTAKCVGLPYETHNKVQNLLNALSMVISKYPCNTHPIAARLTQIIFITSRYSLPLTTPLLIENSSLTPLRNHGPPHHAPQPPSYQRTFRARYQIATTFMSFETSASICLAKPGGGPAVIPTLGEKKVMDLSLMCSALLEVEELLDRSTRKEQNGPGPSLTREEWDDLFDSYLMVVELELLPDVNKPGDYKKLEKLDG